MGAEAKQQVTVTMPLYRWLMLIGALGNMADQSWYDALVDRVLGVVDP